MKKHLLILSFLIVLLGCKNETTLSSEEKRDATKQNEFAIIIHGGAGTILKKNMSDEKEVEYKAKLEEAIKVGHAIL